MALTSRRKRQEVGRTDPEETAIGRPAGGDRGRGQARPFGVSDLAAVLATCHRPRRRGRGVEGDQVALERGVSMR